MHAFTAMLLYTVLELYFSLLLSSKAYFKVCFEVRKIWLQFLTCQSHYMHDVATVACIIIINILHH